MTAPRRRCGPAVARGTYRRRSYGLVWREISDMPFTVTDDDNRHLDYSAHLAGEEVVRTLTDAFDDLERIVASVRQPPSATTRPQPRPRRPDGPQQPN